MVGNFFDPSGYSLAIHVFIKLLGVIYLIAYVPLLPQIRGIVGEHGIQPVSLYLANMKKRFGKKAFYNAPTLFWFNSSDTALVVAILGIIGCSLLLIFGIYPQWMLLFLAILHLSLITAGQEFMAYAPETLLMQLTVISLLLTSTTPLNKIAWIGLNFLLFRFHFQAGICKLLTKDQTFRSLTALSYHYQTQPIPNTIAWYADKLPMWFHKIALGIMFYLELIVPFAIFSPPELRFWVFVQLVGLQFFIWLTGNFSYLNYLTVVACTILLHNRFLEPILGTPSTQAFPPTPAVWQAGITTLSVVFLLCEFVSFLHPYIFKKNFDKVIYFLLPLRIGKPHYLFASLTTTRYEVIVEGSDDGKLWKEYVFKGKPGDISQRPKRVSPHLPRLDSRMWYLTFGGFKQELWFQQFLLKLLEGSSQVTRLLKFNPFPKTPPHYIRATIFSYTFTTFKEKAETKNWWKRKEFMKFIHPVDRETLKMRVLKAQKNLIIN